MEHTRRTGRGGDPANALGEAIVGQLEGRCANDDHQFADLQLEARGSLRHTHRIFEWSQITAHDPIVAYSIAIFASFFKARKYHA